MSTIQKKAQAAAEYFISPARHPEDYVVLSGMEANTLVGPIPVVGPLLFSREFEYGFPTTPVIKDDIAPLLDTLKEHPEDVEFVLIGFHYCLVKSQGEIKTELVPVDKLTLTPFQLLQLRAQVYFFISSSTQETNRVEPQCWN